MADDTSGMESSFGVTQENTRRIYCVVSQDHKRKLPDLQAHQLDKAFELLKHYGAKVAHTSVDKVLAQSQRLPGFSYIIPEFEGELYEHLMSLEARIYGPLAIIQSLNQTGKIPKYPKPLLAMYCVNFNVTVTGLSLEDRKEVFEKIDALGGISSGSMTPNTTHLFAKACDPKSDKYRRAAKQKLLIVKPDWVQYAYEQAKEGTMSVDNTIPITDYLIDVFTGCIFTTSGINGSDRLKIAELVRQNGGTFSGAMERDKCTHLIIESNTGEKYRKALEWGTVKIVTMKWLTKSAETGIRQDEDDYKPGTKTSTQMPHNKTLMAPDVSNIFSKSRQPVPASAVSSNNSIVAGDHTMMRPRKTVAAPFTTSTSRRNQSFSRMDSSQLSTKPNDPVMDFDISLFEDGYGEYLVDCRLHFYEVTDEQKRIYRRLGNCTGCSIVDTITSATHIIVPPGNYSSKQLKDLKEALDRDIEVVRCEWLIECVKLQSNVDAEEYVYPGLAENNGAVRQSKIGSSIDREFNVPQDVLDAINPACDLSSMHNTRSFVERLEEVQIVNDLEEDERDNEHNESTLNGDEEMVDLNKTVNEGDLNNANDDKDESSFDAFGGLHNMDATINERQEEDDDDEPVFIIPSGPPASGPLAASTPKSRTTGTPRASASSNIAAVDADAPMPSPIPSTATTQRSAAARTTRNDKNIENNPQSSSNGAGYNQDGLNLSMPLNEYLSGNRPVRLNLPYAQMLAQISDESEPDSPTLDPIKLKQTLAIMAKNSCQSDSEYYRAMGNQPRGDDREWRDMSLYRQPVVHDFRSPLKRPLPDLPQRQKAAYENFDDVAVTSAASVEEEQEAATNQIEDAEMIDKANEQDVVAVKDAAETPHEPVQKPSFPPQKQKSFGMLPDDLLERCEAVSSVSNGDVEKLSQRKSAPVLTAIEKPVTPVKAPSANLLSFNEQLSFSNDENIPEQETSSPAKIVWGGQYSSQDVPKLDVVAKNRNFIPSTQQLATAFNDNNMFDGDSADPFQRLSNQNLLEKNKRKNAEQKKISQENRNKAEQIAVASAADKVIEEPVVPVEAENDVEMSIEEQHAVPGAENNQQVAPPKEAVALPKPQANAEDDSFNETWPESPEVPPPKVTKVKPRPPRLFGLDMEEEEEESDNDAADISLNILAKVKAKPKKKAPTPQPAEVSRHVAAASPPAAAVDAPSIEPSRRSQRIVKRKVDEAAKSPVPTEPQPKRGKRGSSTSAAAVPAPEPEEQPKNKKDKNPEPTCSHYRNVIFTNFEEPERKKLQEQVSSIQGTNLDETIDMPIADIVVCGRLQRSEKLMVALAAGKYIVTSQYIVQSVRQGKWLPRDEWEIGNPKAARKRIDTSNVKDQTIAEKIKDSCYRLRYKAETLGHGAFYGWKAIIFAQNGESLKRIIEAGGGEAKLFTAVPINEYKNFTMAIIASKNAAGLFTEKERDVLNKNSLPYYTDQVLSNYLLSVDTEDALKKSWHGWYRQFLQTSRRK